MKLTKKLFTLALSIIMICSLAIPAFAAGTGTITINNASADNTYSIYRMLNLKTYDTTAGTYAYEVLPDWEDFFAEDLGGGTPGAGYAYIHEDSHGVLTWVADDKPATVAAFAKLALAYAESKSITPDKTSATPGEMILNPATATEPSKGVFSNLELGYYLVDSTMGALCGLTTTNPNASINAKNGAPTIDKQVKEDSTEQWGGSNTADIGQTVEFRTTINVHAGAENYVLHDTMSAGLTFDAVTKIEHVVPPAAATIVDPSNYTVKTAPGITADPADDVSDTCTFEVTFNQAFCDTLKTNDKIIVYYQAMLNRHAVTGTDSNTNTAILEFGEDHKTTPDSTQTYTYAFDLIKTDGQNTPINGAEFKIYDAVTGGNEVKVVKWIPDGGTWDGKTYRRARADETGESIVITTTPAGQVRLLGFDNGTYYLEETVTPDGYNPLSARQEFIISDANDDAIFNAGIYSVGSGVQVVNRSGQMLPETGGIGTTIFYVTGSILAVGAAILLVTKKRMNGAR